MPRSATPGSGGRPLHGLGQHRAVVPARAEDDLQVQLEAGRREPLQSGSRAGRGPSHQADAGLVVPGVQRHVQRREAQLLDAREVGLVEVRERREVAVQKGEPVVVVLHGEAGAQPGRDLVDEAEATAVAAHARRRAEAVVAQRDAVPLAGAGHDDEVERVPVAQHGQPEDAVGGGHLEVEHVLRRGAVEARDAVARAQPGALRGVLDGGHRQARAGRARRARPRSPRRSPASAPTERLQSGDGGLDLLVGRRGAGRHADAAAPANQAGSSSAADSM